MKAAEIEASPPIASPGTSVTGRLDWMGALFVTALVLICGLAAFVGLAPLRLFQHDTFFLLDNAYRVAQGQVPHRDFSSAWGPFTYLIEATGLMFSGMRPSGIGYANALFGGLIGVWAYKLGRSRLFPGYACLIGIYTALLITGPFSLGWGALHFSHAMTYNRYGFALLGIILVECAGHALSGNPGGRQAMAGALSTGSALAVLAFLKVTYAMMAIPFILIAFSCGAARKRRFTVLCMAFGIVTALVLCYLRFDLPDMFRDLAMAANGRSRSWKPGEIFNLAFGQLRESAPLLLLAVVAGGKTARLRACLIAVLTLGVGGVLISTNHQPSTSPLNGFAAIVLANAAIERFRTGHGARAAPETRNFIAVFLSAMCIVPLCAANGLSLVAAAIEEHRPADAPAVRLASDRGASMIFGPVPVLMTTETGGPAYVNALNDGLELLRRHTGSRDGVLTIDMMNPFNYLLDRPSPRGRMSAAAYNYTFSDSAHPSADRFFGDARYVMVRKYSRSAGDFQIEDYDIEGLRRVYEPALQERFRLIEETGHWVLYGHR